MAAKQTEFAERLAEWDRKLKDASLELRQWAKKIDGDRRNFRAAHPDGASPAVAHSCPRAPQVALE